MRSETRTSRRSRERPDERRRGFLVRKLRQYQIYLLVALGLCMMVAAGFVLAHSTAAVEDWRTEVIGAAHQLVRNSVRGEIRTSFADADETQLEKLSGDKYTISGWVDLISEGGQIDRQHFSCTLHRDDGGEWIAENVAVTPQ